MVPKLLSSGRSFKGLAQYLTHDPKEQTANRVAWTHTLNCANDHVPSAVHEMYTTMQDADALKQEAGIKPGGRPLQKPVKHFSLNWHPDNAPSKEHMIEATQSFLEHMGWHEHQALLAAHSDTDHAHVHVMLNAVHPLTGKKLDDGLERRRAQEWALEYERQQGKIHCEERLKPAEEREPSPPRNVWMDLDAGKEQATADEKARKQFDASYMAREDMRAGMEGQEWEILKARQREEREQFFEEGSKEYRKAWREAYRDVQREFKPEWREYYRLHRMDDPRAEYMDVDIIERQQAAVRGRAADAAVDLRESRDEVYRELLDRQRDERHDLHARQEQGERSYHLLDLVNEAPDAEGAALNTRIGSEFRSAANEVTGLHAEAAHEHEEPHEASISDAGGVRSPEDSVSAMGASAIGGFAQIAERIFDAFFSGETVKAPPPPPRPEPAFKPENAFQRAAEAARKHAEEQMQEDRNREYWNDRERKRD